MDELVEKRVGDGKMQRTTNQYLRINGSVITKRRGPASLASHQPGKGAHGAARIPQILSVSDGRVHKARKIGPWTRRQVVKGRAKSILESAGIGDAPASHITAIVDGVVTSRIHMEWSRGEVSWDMVSYDLSSGDGSLHVRQTFLHSAKTRPELFVSANLRGLAKTQATNAFLAFDGLGDCVGTKCADAKERQLDAINESAFADGIAITACLAIETVAGIPVCIAATAYAVYKARIADRETGRWQKCVREAEQACRVCYAQSSIGGQLSGGLASSGSMGKGAGDAGRALAQTEECQVGWEFLDGSAGGTADAGSFSGSSDSGSSGSSSGDTTCYYYAEWDDNGDITYLELLYCEDDA